ncbi:MAG TPA: FxsB family cyclophane-forming radical SAM/SPASM peptide maturase [Thermoanaerobaculia bacterium]|nr:FxsB family cyclophane-forming radical SAM/SPASM peptide maturase [Thermoanaerobaculia bacterium]
MHLFICKVASRCNIDCDYCYVYHHADQGWRRQPVKMGLATATQLGRRINEHAARHRLASVEVVMHGGEPLVVGADYLRQWCETVQAAAQDTAVGFSMQTNGTLFDDAALAFCLEWNVKVGLSLDGPRAVNDLHRLDRRKRSSFDAVERALTLLSKGEGRRIWSGFLSVIDLRSDPLEVYSYLQAFRPNMIEFLLPLGHYDLRPVGKEADLENTPYADWMLRIFKAWYEERPQTITIRRFRDVIALLAGAGDASEEWGVQPVDFAVIESNGDIEAVDSLKTTFPGANHLGLNLRDHGFDDMFSAPLVIERQSRWNSICSTCRACPVVKVCGGGYFPHRYSRDNGFQNPSVYCSDLKKMIGEIYAAVRQDLDRYQQSPGAP